MSAGREHERRRKKPAGSSVKLWHWLTTRRAALLALVVCALVLSVAVPLRTYLSQRAELQDQQQQQQVLRAEQSELVQRQAQLADPAQVRTELRERFQYVMPGEIPYGVQLPPGATGTGSTGSNGQPNSSSVWYQQLWNTIATGQP